MKMRPGLRAHSLREFLSKGAGQARAAAPLLRKGGLAGLGLIGLLIGFVQTVLELIFRETYEALDRRNEARIKKGSEIMSKRREWRDRDDDDDFEDRTSYKRKMEDARRRYELEIRASRDVMREQRRAEGRVKRMWTLASVGLGIFLGAILGDAINPLAGIGFGLFIGGSVSWVGSLFLNRAAKKATTTTSAMPVARRPEIQAPTVGENILPQGRTELVQQVLGEAATSLRAMDAVMSKMRHPDSVASVARIVAVGNRIMQAVATDPDRLAIAQRVFTYYCPEAVKVAEALAKLEADPAPDVERITSTQTVLRKLEVLFERTELELKAGDSKELDIDLRLLDQSIEADLKSR